MFYSPLRYPGGKNRLAKSIAKICIENNINGHYIEPYAGGASIALNLLIEKKIKRITINDYDRSIYAFWYCVLNRTNKLCSLIKNTEINIVNWRKQKNVQKQKNEIDLLKLGFSAFFLNRTNYSGIINAGAIGGLAQKGIYKIDCRFNKIELIKKIKLIAKYKKQIKLYNLDAVKLIKNQRRNPNKEKAIFYFDPPYYLKGSSLYMNYYKKNEHKKVSEEIRKIKNAHWIITYDDNEEIRKIYQWVNKNIEYQLKHFAYKAKLGKELMFFSDSLDLPNNLNLTF